jgi:hypothetical protein
VLIVAAPVGIDVLKERVASPLFALIELSRWSATRRDNRLAVMEAGMYYYKGDCSDTKRIDEVEIKISVKRRMTWNTVGL